MLIKNPRRAGLVALAVVGLFAGVGAFVLATAGGGEPLCRVTPRISDWEFQRFVVQPESSCTEDVVGSYQMECWVVHRHTWSWESHKQRPGGSFVQEGSATMTLPGPSYRSEEFEGTIGDRYKPRCTLRLEQGDTFTGEGPSVKL